MAPTKKRKYKDEYAAFGFRCKWDKLEPKPQCFICGKVLCNDSMKPGMLQQHLRNTHPGHADDSKECMLQKKARFEASGTLNALGFTAPKNSVLEASFKVAYRIAREKKPHTVGETLIKPCALDMVELVCGTREKNLIAKIPLSNDTIRRRIDDMSGDILCQVIEQIRASPFGFSMQLDESTDVSQCSQLLVFVRYFHGQDIKEEFLFCEPLLTTTKAVDVLNLVKTFAEKHQLPLDKLSSLCTDGAPAMLGHKSGFAALIKREFPNVTVTHCVLHRHALATKTLPEELKNTLSTVVTVVNLIRGRALNHRLFKALCQEMGSEHEVLLYHTEVRWLSRGKVMNRVYELRLEIKTFLEDHRNKDLRETFNEPSFLPSLAYLADIFCHLNELNCSMQGRAVTIFDAREKINSFTQKLCLWKRRVVNNNFANFPCLDDYLNDEEKILSPELKECITTHLHKLSTSFEGYFEDIPKDDKDIWVRNPFDCDMALIEDDNEIKDDFIELRSSRVLENAFSNITIQKFWCSDQVVQAFPEISKVAICALIPFVTSYLCEAGFSTLVTMKTKARNRLDVRDDMRVALANTIPRFDVLVQEKQQHGS